MKKGKTGESKVQKIRTNKKDAYEIKNDPFIKSLSME